MNNAALRDLIFWSLSLLVISYILYITSRYLISIDILDSIRGNGPAEAPRGVALRFSILFILEVASWLYCLKNVILTASSISENGVKK